ncbi:MAG: four helix bundle protein [candidate division Zixibacteria bacterium]|nr:four helix bundle protein [candidate division Zixibacteria bacterium]
MYEFEKLEIWQLSLELIEVVNKSSKKIPYNDSFGLRGQLCRAALSTSLNIAEGKGSGSDKEFKRFLLMALRSIYEVVAALKVAVKLKYFKETEIKPVLALCDKLGAKTNKFISTIKSRIENS